jgi:lipid A 3-O-deacylase
LRAGVVIMLAAFATRGLAADGVFATWGTGNHVDIYGLGIGTGDWQRWPVHDDWAISVSGLFGAALWVGLDQDTAHKYLVDFFAYPVLRLDFSETSGVVPYVEGSVGANLLTHTRINDDRDLSTAYQFGEFLGAGMTFGERRQYDLAVRVQHVSNANIKLPNAGVTWGSVVFQYRFDGT